jgi:archaemetzincin
MGTIRVVPLPGSDDVDFEGLGASLAEVLHRSIELASPIGDLGFAFDAERDQFGSRAILAALLRHRANGSDRILGVTGRDLFVPILTFVFGEAQLDGPSAVVSTFRLANERYGLPRDAELLQERLEKEAIHELGHAYGLVHCGSDRCVMRRSTYVEDIDQKDLMPCMECALRLVEAR